MSQDQKVHVKSEIKQEKFSLMKSPMLWIGVLAFVILAIWAFSTVSAYEALNEPTGNNLSLNPELSAARRSAEVAVIGRESDYLAKNPELKSALIYAESARSESPYSLAANPELKVAQRYAESAKEAQEKSRVWVANPELSAANRFVETSAVSLEEANLYQNPELKVVASQAEILADFDPTFYELNPDDIEAARQAALVLTQNFAASEAEIFADFDPTVYELNADDIEAARQAALALSQSYANSQPEILADFDPTVYELDADDIEAARQAAQQLVMSPADHEKITFSRTAAELDWTRSYGASE